MIRFTVFAGCAVAATAAPTSINHKKQQRPGEARSYDCPKGFELQSKACVAQEFHAETLICPQGTRETDGQCMTFSPVLKECPNGYTSSGKQCIRPINHPATPFCQDGYMLTGKTCEKFVPVPAYCPPGYTQDKNGCAQYTAKLSECPTGFTRSAKGKCLLTTTYPKTPTCSAEYNLEGNMCVKFNPLSAFCPTRFQQDKNGCSQYANKLSECPVGFVRHGKGACKKVTTFPKTPTCSAEYTLENNSCVKHVPLPAFCPSGFQQDKDGCALYTNKLSNCPAGFSQSHKGCKKTTLIPRIPQCSEGFTLQENTCTQSILQPAFTVCNTGIKQGDMCVTTQTAGIEFICQHGSTLQGNNCMTRETFDCSNTVFDTVCTQPAIPQYGKTDIPQYGKKSAFRHLGLKKGKKGGSYMSMYSKKQPVYSKAHSVMSYGKGAPAMPYGKSAPAMSYGKGGYGGYGRFLGKKSKKHATFTYAKAAPQPICNQVPRLIQKTCPRNNLVPAQGVCPKGFEMSGATCTATLSQVAQIVQPQPKIVTLAANMVCPAGGCSYTEKAELQYFCPQGYSDAGDRCLKTAELIQLAPQRVAVAVTMICTGGQEPSCSNTEEAPLNYFCPNGYTDAGDRCLKTAELIQPAPQRVAIAATMICTGGQGPACMTTEEAALNYFCANGYTDAGDRCLKTAELIQPAPRTLTSAAQYQCSNGFNLSGKNCLSTESAAFNEYCANGFQHIGNRCARFSDHLSVCTIGQKTANGCVVTKTVSPQVTIVRTCTKGQKGC